MISRSLFVESNKLRVFDLDDTIVRTDSYIYIVHQNGRKSKLTPGEYAVYNEKPGDKFDFTDFHSIKNPKPIKIYFNLLKAFATHNKTVYILTARAGYKPIKDFITDSGIKNVYVVALGDSNPQKKADWIERQILDNKIDDVFFIDDSEKNVGAVRNMLKRYPKVKANVRQAILESERKKLFI
jgi:FMN phosphatase YigB (HAD superfamily)